MIRSYHEFMDVQINGGSSSEESSQLSSAPASRPDPMSLLFLTLAQGCEVVAHNELTSRKMYFRDTTNTGSNADKTV